MIESLDVDAGGGLRLHVEVSGTGPSLLLLHGFTGSTETWKQLRPYLESAHRVAAIDLPGHGASSSPADPARYSLPRVADDIACVMDAARIERSAVLGYSLGGRTALHFAITHPDRVSALILESASPGLVDDVARRERRKSDEELAGFIEREGITAFVNHWESLSLWESQQSLPGDVRDGLRRQRLRNDARGLANSLRGAGSGAHASLADRLEEIDIPTLLIAGELDPKYTDIARHVEQSMPNARSVIIAGAGHAVHLEQPEAFVRATLDFLNTVPSVRQHAQGV